MVTQAVQKQIDTFIQRLRNNLDVGKIILYGSAAQPKQVPHDIDMVVVADFPTDDPESYLYDLYTDIPRSIDFHVYGVSLQDQSVSPFLQQAMKEGTVLYTG